MTVTLLDPTRAIEPPDISQIVTEDDTPVDNLFSAKQQRLLVEPLYSSWHYESTFLADVNVGVFSAVHRPPIVPDMFLSLDVEVAENWWAKEHRSYFLWEFGKPPDLVVEIVSNNKGHEADEKLQEYARIGVRYYVIYDPQVLIQETPLRIYELHVRGYRLRHDQQLAEVGLALTLWEGVFEGKQTQWLRWCTPDGPLIPTGAERAEQERMRAEQERTRAERLTAQLRALGIEPEA